MVTMCLITNKFTQQTKRHDTSFIIHFLYKGYTMNVQQKVTAACPRNYLEISIKLYTVVWTKWHQENLLLHLTHNTHFKQGSVLTTSVVFETNKLHNIICMIKHTDRINIYNWKQCIPTQILNKWHGKSTHLMW